MSIKSSQEQNKNRAWFYEYAILALLAFAIGVGIAGISAYSLDRVALVCQEGC